MSNHSQINKLIVNTVLQYLKIHLRCLSLFFYDLSSFFMENIQSYENVDYIKYKIIKMVSSNLPKNDGNPTEKYAWL